MSTMGSIRGKTLATTFGLAFLALSAVPSQAG